TFQNGEPGGALLNFTGSQSITLESMQFPTNTWTGNFNVTKSVDAGRINFIQDSGDFTGENFENDPYNRINWDGIPVDIKVFLEGPYNGTEMNSNLTSILPLSQPYNTPPWNYSGTESVSSIPGDVVDWLLVEFRDASNASSATLLTSIATQAAFVNNNGEVAGLDGLDCIYFDQLITNQLFIVIWHRNHLGVLSAFSPQEIDGIYSYDFSLDAGQVYGGTGGHKEIGTGIWGMMSGDGDADGDINDLDIENAWSAQVGESGYLNSDYNLDINTDNKDKNDYWLPNNGTGSQVP
ncbi:MAG: hypothetical protein K8S16_03765, partial [Bacteroidales bacterium]|nr:hypothetical protein [Bacteroidales bacterium]